MIKKERERRQLTSSALALPFSVKQPVDLYRPGIKKVLELPISPRKVQLLRWLSGLVN